VVCFVCGRCSAGEREEEILKKERERERERERAIGIGFLSSLQKHCNREMKEIERESFYNFLLFSLLFLLWFRHIVV
jgi:hypothetical protein